MLREEKERSQMCIRDRSEGYSSDEADAIAAKAVDDARSETMESVRRDYSGLTG